MNGTRRGVLSGSLAGALALTLLPHPVRAASDARLAEAIRAAIGDAVPRDGGIELWLPELVDNGAQVPLAITVASPMTQYDHIVAIHVFAPANPTPGVASFRLFPGLARAEVETRIRVAEDQDILVLARDSAGRVWRASSPVKVVHGGCRG